jgi:hypothetical protein
VYTGNVLPGRRTIPCYISTGSFVLVTNPDKSLRFSSRLQEIVLSNELPELPAAVLHSEESMGRWKKLRGQK